MYGVKYACMSKSLFVRTRQRRTARLRAQRREELCNPVIKYLMSRENEAETLDEQEHYKFCRRVVSLALRARLSLSWALFTTTTADTQTN